MSIFFIFLFPGAAASAQDGPPDFSRDTFEVYLFLLEDCVICQNYTPYLRQLYSQYASGRLRFTGLFPNRFSSREKIATFQKKYQLPFELKRDYYQTRTRQFGAKITPEAVVYNASRDEVVYRGRIDDQYVSLGKRRTVKTTSELEDALQAILDNRLPAVQETQAVGCFISFVK